MRPSGFPVKKEGANHRGPRRCVRIDDPVRNGGGPGNSYPRNKVGNDATPPFQRETLARGQMGVKRTPAGLLIERRELRPGKFAADARQRKG